MLVREAPGSPGISYRRESGKLAGTGAQSYSAGNATAARKKLCVTRKAPNRFSACGFLCAHPACRAAVETDPHRAWREFPQITGLPRVNSQIKPQPCPVDFRRKGRVQIMEYANAKWPGTPARCEKRIWEGLDQNRQHLGFKAIGVQIRHIRHDFFPCERAEFCLVLPLPRTGQSGIARPGANAARCAGPISLVYLTRLERHFRFLRSWFWPCLGIKSHSVPCRPLPPRTCLLDWAWSFRPGA